MITNQLKKSITLYRNQFEHFTEEMFQSNQIERLSIELDSIMFRIKYMNKNNLDMDKIPYWRDEFSKKAIQMRKCFSKFLFEFVCKIITIPNEYKLDDLIDILAEDVKIDQSYVKFDMIVISDNCGFLRYIDDSIPDDVYNMFPDEYFRFYTDSYNDGIAKAFPELFEIKHQKEIGTGDDSDVFVHSVTLQTSETCNLQCFPKGTKIRMANGSSKDISEIEIGDEILGVDEGIIDDEMAEESDWFYDEERIHPTKVTKIFIQKSEVVGYGWRNYETYTDENGNDAIEEKDCHWITPEHPCLTIDREYKPFIDVINDIHSGFVMYAPRWGVDSVGSDELLLSDYRKEVTVYNLETECHTFIADDLIVHNCTYCVGPDTLIHMAESTVKKIKDIQVGDVVKVFDEYPPLKDIHPTKLNLKDQFYDAKVTQVFKHTDQVVEIKSPYIRRHLYITKNHRVLTNTGWKMVGSLIPRSKRH